MCIDPHQTGFVGKGSDHLQLIKFWPFCIPERVIIIGSTFLQWMRSVCFSLSAFHCNLCWRGWLKKPWRSRQTLDSMFQEQLEEDWEGNTRLIDTSGLCTTVRTIRHKARIAAAAEIAVCRMCCVSFQLERCFQRFTAFYSGQHSGRKLNWLYNMSKGEVVTNCFKNRYTLQVHLPLILLSSLVWFCQIMLISRELWRLLEWFYTGQMPFLPLTFRKQW